MGGGKGGGGSPPPATDPAATAAAQGQVNKETAIAQARLNRVNEVTPYGSRTYTETPAEGDPEIYQGTATTTLNPLAQEAFDAEQRVGRDMNLLGEQQVGRVNDTLGTPFDLGGVGGIKDNIDTSGFTQYVGNPGQSMEDAIYGKHTARLDPRFSQEEGDLQTRLANQGIVAGSDAYNREMDNFGRYKTDAYGQARNDAVTQGLPFGNQQRTQQFNEQMAQANLGNASRTQDIQERSFLRNIPLNDVAALMGQQQVNVPQFGAPAQTGVAPTDYAGIVNNNYAGQLSAYNTQQQAASANTAGLYGLGGSAMMAGAMAYGSDRRLKENIKEIGKLENGLKLYIFNYIGIFKDIWGGLPQIGVMSDEVRKVMPHAVSVHSSGFDMVDYSEIYK